MPVSEDEKKMFRAKYGHPKGLDKVDMDLYNRISQKPKINNMDRFIQGASKEYKKIKQNTKNSVTFGQYAKNNINDTYKKVRGKISEYIGKAKNTYTTGKNIYESVKKGKQMYGKYKSQIGKGMRSVKRFLK